ncbi:Abi family protein [Marinobacter piscensis]|uniref:Abi family protein n=1 Tax=Marinobacter piscensis TaxID=1562308 RepID=UPI0016427F8D|nr:Abi family protein [Marinobacter piscensis]
MRYNRPWKSFHEQLELLKSRGMVVTDEAAALDYLQRVGYYRLSAYWYPFRKFKQVQGINAGKQLMKALNQFYPNTQFVDAVRLYLFDKQLRLQAMDALERIEVALRVDIAHRLGKRSTFAHLDPEQLHPSFIRKKLRSGHTRFEKWEEKCLNLQRRSKEDFVKHYRAKHGESFPVWVAVETWDFGAVSQFFSMMQVKDQKALAKRYGVNSWHTFQTWLRSLNYLRNLCAHHSRLWNRNVVDQPSLAGTNNIPWCRSFAGKEDLIARPFLLLAICRHMVKTICPDTEWHNRLAEQMRSFPEQHSQRTLSMMDMGIPEDWNSWW